MGITKPYHRIYRPVNPALPNSGYSNWAYIPDNEYCQSGYSYIRAFMLILEELQYLFQYVEPGEESMCTFSYKIHSLFMRTCIEIEANFKAILAENIYTPDINRFGSPIFNMSVYKKLNVSHHLSSYEVGLPQWASTELLIFKPFKNWEVLNGSIEWYQAYNESKHDRQDNFRKANMKNLLNAISGLLVVITAQFRTETFSLSYGAIGAGGEFPNDMKPTIGGVFLIKYPQNWTEEEMYDFNWAELKKEENRFQKFDYNT